MVPTTTTTVLDQHHPDCPGLVKDLDIGDATSVAGEVFIKAGPDHVSIGFQAAGYIIPATFDGKEVSHADVCPTPTPTTTTSSSQPPPPLHTASTTTTSSDHHSRPTTTTSSTTTTVPPTTTTSSTTTTLAPTTTTTTLPPTTTTEVSRKWFVCKAVRTPGTDEIITHVISVNENAIPDPENDGVHVGDTFSDAQSTSVVIAEDTGQPEPELDECFPTPPTTTTTTSSTTTTTTQPGTTTTTIVRGSLLGIDDFAYCDEETNTPQISITFGNRPDLDGDPGLLTFSDGTEYSGNPLTFQSGQTITFPYPASLTTPLTLTYSIFGETATAVVTLPRGLPAINDHDDGGDAIHHDDPAHREYNDNLLPQHYDHLVVYQYDDEYLYDPVHHYLFDYDAARDVHLRSGGDGLRS